MQNIKYTFPNILLLLAFMFLAVSCGRDLSDDATEATFPKNGDVFIDDFSPGLEYLPYGDSNFEAFSVDTDIKYAGSASMRFDVPNEGDPKGAYAGAIFPDNGGRNLTEFDALTFWAKGTEANTVNDIGFGQDFGENKYEVGIENGLQLTTNWKKYTIPIPDPSKLTQEKGLFWYAEGPQDGKGYSFWIDDLQFVKLGTIAQPRPSIYDGTNVTVQTFLGLTTQIPSTRLTVNLEEGIDRTVNVAAGYFEFTSSDLNVATVDELGLITAVSNGTTVVTAKLNGVDAVGSVTLEVSGTFENAPMPPSRNPDDVISIFSNAYEDEPVDYYNGFWAPFQTTQGGNNLTVNADDILSYSDLNFVGIQFSENVPTIDVSQMTHFHFDVQVREEVEPGDFLTVRLVDAGADNVIGGNDDTSSEITLTNTELKEGEWLSLDVPFTSFGSLSSRSHLGQIIFVTDATIENIYVDNVYFYKESGGGSSEPTTAAPSPLQDPDDVISVFSDAFTNISGTDLNPNWGQATMVSETTIAGNNTLLYQGLNFQGIQLGSSQNVSGMEFLHIDYWAANSSALNTFLISNGPVEAANAMSVPTNGWVSIDIPLGSFSPVDLADIIQLKFDGNGDIYLDNIYFYSEGNGSTEPTQAAPTPMQDPGMVISVYSDAYTNIGGTELNPNWGQATVVSEIFIDGNNTLLYSGLNYQGIQLGSSQNVTGMEFLHIDYWAANSSALNTFLISNGPVELAFEMGVPTNGWVSIDIPLGSFSPVDLADIIQLKFDGNGDIYLDNIYFFGNEIRIEPELPLTFEDGINSVIAFDNGATATVIDNPDMSGNTSTKVLEFSKVMGSAWYSGVVFDETLRTTPLIDLTNGTVFTIKIWSPTPGVIVRFQLEGGAAPAYEVFQTVNDANQWVTLTYDFTSQVNASDTYPRFSVFPDFDTSNQNPVAVGAIYYIDDVSQQ
ncbi:Ig-like domain-containing protein [bacterium]|nr:Ig-like domain-containing protein [bacterium]